MHGKVSSLSSASRDSEGSLKDPEEDASKDSGENSLELTVNSSEDQKFGVVLILLLNLLRNRYDLSQGKQCEG